MKTVILIPTYKPDQKFNSFILHLSKESKLDIVIVNDGSGKEFDENFTGLTRIGNVTILNHDINKGKGAALKTGFEYTLNKKTYSGVVTADADGQHKVGDIIEVSKSLEYNTDKFIIGARVFSGNIPLRSKFGNILTRLLFKLIYRINISDTQTGLRGIPLVLLPTLLSIPYNRYEYETEMLIKTKKQSVDFIEVPIETIYENNNASSHFNPLIDSIKIYFVLLRYTFVSLLSAFVDFIVFISVYPLLGNILLATYTARAVSLIVNYQLVSKKVFYSGNTTRETFPKYLLLVIISGFTSSFFIFLIHKYVHFPINSSKIIAESILYVLNFYIQKKFIFRKVNT